MLFRSILLRFVSSEVLNKFATAINIKIKIIFYKKTKYIILYYIKMKYSHAVLKLNTEDSAGGEL